MGNNQTEQTSFLDRIGDCFQQTNLCLRPQFQSQELTEFTQSHNYLSLYKDPYYGQCHVLQNKSNKQLCIMIKETLDRKDHQHRLQNLNEIIICGQGPANRNIIRATILADLEKVGFLWKKNQLYIKYDYILFDLEKEFENRMDNNLQFGESQIKTIIKQCTKGYLRLQLTKYTSVRMKHIYFCDDGSEIRLAHPKLFNYRSNLQILSQDYTTQNIYLSPQQIYALEISDYQYQCGWASNSFSFGMIILSLMTMRHLNDIYNYKSCEIDFKKINQLINICNNKYSYHLINIVQELLKEKESQRLIFRNLFNKIQNNQIGSNPIELTLVEQQNKEKQIKQYKIQRKVQQILPKYPNFIAALIKPMVNLNGQYMSVTNEQEMPKNNSRQSQIIASQRFRYSTPYRESVGSYIGSAVNRDTNEKIQSVRHGKGVYQYVDGQAYMGEWKDGKMHGFGKLYFSDKKLRYQGEFKNGLFHGNGTEYTDFQMEDREEEIDEEYIKIYQGNWIKYEGYYNDDKKEGSGKIYFKNGFWRGNFKKGQPNGQGIYTCYRNNRTIKGVWTDGILSQRK